MNRQLFAIALFACVASTVNADSLQPTDSNIQFEREPSYLGEGCIFDIKIDNVHVGYLKPKHILSVAVKNSVKHTIKISFIQHSECGGDYVDMEFIGRAPTLYSVTIGTHSNIVVGEL